MVKVISLPYIFQVLYVLCFNRPRYHVSVYRTIGPLVLNYYYYFFRGGGGKIPAVLFEYFDNAILLV